MNLNLSNLSYCSLRNEITILLELHCSGTRVISARQKLEFVFIAELSRAKRACGAPWIRK